MAGSAVRRKVPASGQLSSRLRTWPQASALITPKTGVPSVKELERSSYRPPKFGGSPHPGLHPTCGQRKIRRRGNRLSRSGRISPPAAKAMTLAATGTANKASSTPHRLPTGRHHCRLRNNTNPIDPPSLTSAEEASHPDSDDRTLTSAQTSAATRACISVSTENRATLRTSSGLPSRTRAP